MCASSDILDEGLTVTCSKYLLFHAPRCWPERWIVVLNFFETFYLILDSMWTKIPHSQGLITKVACMWNLTFNFRYPVINCTIILYAVDAGVLIQGGDSSNASEHFPVENAVDPGVIVQDRPSSCASEHLLVERSVDAGVMIQDTDSPDASENLPVEDAVDPRVIAHYSQTAKSSWASRLFRRIICESLWPRWSTWSFHQSVSCPKTI